MLLTQGTKELSGNKPTDPVQEQGYLFPLGAGSESTQPCTPLENGQDSTMASLNGGERLPSLHSSAPKLHSQQEAHPASFEAALDLPLESL